MQILIRADSVTIDGYVNAVERLSRTLKSRLGELFQERIRKGAFTRALGRTDDVLLLENHDMSRVLGGTKQGNLKLTEDSIGLRATATLTDPEAIDKARRGDYIGWSFAFKDRDVEKDEEHGMRIRNVNDLDLREVSLIDRRKRPAYDGTLVSVRTDDDEIVNYAEIFETDVEMREESIEENTNNTEEGGGVEDIDYSKWENMIKDMKGEN